jgi:ABC-type uncharacterized transport system auxiliary subunit
MSLIRHLVFVPLWALAGCSGLLHSTAPALQLYVLQPPQLVTAHADVDRAAPTLRISRPLPGPALNTDRIALLRPGNRLYYYAGSRWSAPLADLVSDLELAVFRIDPTWSAVADDRSTFNADYLLQTSIEHFTAEYVSDSAAPVVHVELHGLLVRRRDGTLVGSFSINQSITAGENRMASVVAAFSQAAQQACSEVQAKSDELLRSVKSPPTP